MSLPYRRVLKTQAWYTFTLVLSVRFLFVQTLCDSRDITVAAFPIMALISASREIVLGMVEPRYLKLSTTLSVFSLMVIEGGDGAL